MQRVEAWPEAARVELAQIALEIDAGLSAGPITRHRTSSKASIAVLKAAREGRFAADDHVREV
jgi:hypothetical protein